MRGIDHNRANMNLRNKPEKSSNYIRGWNDVREGSTKPNSTHPYYRKGFNDARQYYAGKGA